MNKQETVERLKPMPLGTGDVKSSSTELSVALLRECAFNFEANHPKRPILRPFPCEFDKSEF
jgi:hypothetical protein